MGFEIPEHEVSTPTIPVNTPHPGATKAAVVVSHHPLNPSHTQFTPDPQSVDPEHSHPAIDTDETTTLSHALVESITDFLRAGFSVEIDGFGIVSPQTTSAERSYSVEGSQVRRWEETLSLSFDKCREVTAFHRERFPRLIDTKDLARATHLELPCDEGLRLNERATRRRIVALFRTLKTEVIERGYSGALAPLGDFYALHNRQGETLNDRFAGSDIFLVPRFTRRIRLSETRRFERPILEHPWEIFEAAYGTPAGKLRIDLGVELRALGYTFSPEEETQFLGEKFIEVGVFVTGERDGKPLLTYVTSGVRRLAQGKGGGGNELTFQLPVSHDSTTPSQTALPEWPTRALTLGWLLVLSSRSRTIPPGVGFSADAPLIPDCDTDLCAVFTTPFHSIRTPQRDTEGEFSFINIVGITTTEAAFARRFGGSHLLNLLEHRSLDQATKPTRSGVIGRSVIEPPVVTNA